MAKRTFKAGVTSQTVDVFIMDSSSTIGAGLSGLAFNTAGLKAYYRKGATGSATAITLATQTVGGAWSSGGFVEIDATNMKGVYRLDVPDTVFASSPWATLYLYGATNMAPVALELEIVAIDPFDAVRLGLTALPNAAAEAAGGLYTRGSGAGQINQSANGQVDVDAKKINSVSAASVTTVNANLGTTQPVNFTGTGASALVKGDTVDIAGTAVTAAAGIPEVKVASIATDAITAAAIAADAIGSSELAASAVTEIQTGLATSASISTLQTSVDDIPTNAELATALGTADDAVLAQVALVKAKTDNLPADPADASDIAGAFVTVNTTLATIAGYVDTEIGTIITDIAAVKSDTAAILLDTGTDGVVVNAAGLATDAVNEIADGILNRDMSLGTDSGSTTFRTMRQALRFLRNKWDVVAGTLTVRKEDDATASWTSTVTGTAGADPITGSDPA